MTLDDGHDREMVGTNQVDDSIVSEDPFPNVVLLSFGDLTAELGIVDQYLGGGDDLFGKLPGMGRGIFRDRIFDVTQINPGTV